MRRIVGVLLQHFDECTFLEEVRMCLDVSTFMHLLEFTNGVERELLSFFSGQRRHGGLFTDPGTHPGNVTHAPDNIPGVTCDA